MAEGDNADAQWSENQLGGEDGERTVNCLRGRLLAERTVSRNARDQAEQLGIKLVELENLLKAETRSRNRAEKKLKSLMKKLASMNMCYEEADISSVSSTASSKRDKLQEPKETDESPRGSADFPQNDSQHSLFEACLPDSEMPPTDSEIIGQSIRQNAAVENSSAADELSVESSTVKDHKQGDDQDPDSPVDNSMAIVSVDVPQESTHTVDPEVLDDTVKEVLETLRRAKEQLMSSMERRQTNMIKVG